MTTLIILIILIAVFLLWYAAVPRRAALASGTRSADSHGPGLPTDGWFRLGTYNIHGGKGADGVRDLRRTADVIGGTHIIALQEVRAGWLRDQTRDLGEMLKIDGLFSPTLRRWFRDYRGNALLSVFPVTRWQSYALPSAGGHRYRVYSVAEVSVDGQVVSVLFTHLHTRAGRAQQLGLVLQHFERLPPPSVLIGDLNTGQGDSLLSHLPGGARDCIGQVLGPGDGPRVDWILTRGFEVRAGGREESKVSDHPYFWVEVRIP